MKSIESLTKLITTLRGKNGCPWDRKQTPQSMSVYLIEEAHELLDAIESGKTDDICEELGDVLFQLFFIAAIYNDRGEFNLDDAARSIMEKMIRRHPHVFGDTKLSTSDEVKAQWREIKKTEKPASPESVLDSVPASLPALMRAYRISERAARTDFDWEALSGVMKQTESEWQEFKDEIGNYGEKKGSADREKAAMEFGDILFSLVNVARLAKIHPENALTASTRKFQKRFHQMEKIADQSGQRIEDVPQSEKEKLWKKIKKAESR